MGTSAPELAVSLSAAVRDQADIAFGNVVGSNVFNVLFILGASAVVAPLVVSRRMVRIEVPIMLGVSLLAWGLSADGRVARWEGVVLLALLLGYVLLQVRVARSGNGSSPEAAAALPPGAPRRFAAQLAWIGVGLALLVVGSHLLVEGAVTIARTLGLSELVVGLTIVAAGTSMPEVATSLIATYRGERDIAVGNVVGSNVFNLLGVLGMSAAVAPGGVHVAPSALAFDVPVMCATAFACLPIFFTEHRIARWEGWLFLGYYAAYVTFLILAATRHDALPRFSAILLEFVIPLTVVTLALLVVRAARRGARNNPAA
jgi:cation:H+ antiporter